MIVKQTTNLNWCIQCIYIQVPSSVVHSLFEYHSRIRCRGSLQLTETEKKLCKQMVKCKPTVSTHLYVKLNFRSVNKSIQIIPIYENKHRPEPSALPITQNSRNLEVLRHHPQMRSLGLSPLLCDTSRRNAPWREVPYCAMHGMLLWRKRGVFHMDQANSLSVQSNGSFLPVPNGNEWR